MKTGPIIVIEDDADDKAILEEVFTDLNLNNPLLWFTRSEEALEYLNSTAEQPFIVFSDVNLPGNSGIEFKKQVDADERLRKKSIPFIFYSTSANQHIVNQAYLDMTVQGFFKKEDNYNDIKKTVSIIVEYWKTCWHPNAGI